MNNLYFLFWALVGSFTIYVAAISLIFGVQPSLSVTYKVLGEKWRKPFWFLMFTSWALMSMVLAQSGLIVFAGFGMALVGAAPVFWDKEEKKPHFFGAAISALFSQLFIFFCVSGGEWITLTWLLAVLFTILVVGKRTRLFWLEMLCFYGFFIGLYYSIGNV